MGEPAAFEELYRAHSPRLFGLTCRMVGRSHAEDLLQDVFLTAHRKLDKYRGESSLGTWLFRLATNVCLDFLRSRGNRNAQMSCASSRSARWVSGWNSPAHGRSRGREIVSWAFQQLRNRYSACAATHNASYRQSASPNSAPMPSRRKPAAYARPAVSIRQSKFFFGPEVCRSS